MAELSEAQARADAPDLIKPPGVNEEDHRAVNRLELFFDLSLVLVFARLADSLAADVSWGVAARLAALVTLLWWAWTTVMLHANRFDTDDVIFRLLTLMGMIAVIAMAAAIVDLTGSTGQWFALAYGALRWVLVAQYARAWRHVGEARAAVTPYLVCHALSGAVWVASAAMPAPARFWAWGAAFAIDVAAPLWASNRTNRVPLHLEHLPERYGLLIILVLGESIAAITVGVDHGHWTGATVLAGLPAFLLAAALWWSYFDLTGAAAKAWLLRKGAESRRGVHDVYLYAHLPITLGLILVGVGLELAIAHAADPVLAYAYRAVLVAGTVLYLLSATMLQAVMAGRLRAALPWPGVAAVLAIGALWLPSAHLVLTALAVVVGATVVAGLVQRQKGRLPTAKV